MTRARLLLKRLAVALAGPVARAAPRWLLRPDCVPIFMLHRFGQAPGRSPGHDPALVTAALRYLRRQRYTVLGLDELVQRLLDDALPPRAVAFTVDDGYADQASLGAELFLQQDCPVTMFLVSGFIDGATWPVDARVAWLLAQARQPVTLATAAGPRQLDPANAPACQPLRRQLVAELKLLPLAQAQARVAALAAQLQVALPAAAPAAYAPLSWAEARRLESRGVRFGAHSVNHALLAREDDATASTEIHASLERLQAELAHPSRIFCYPNGLAADYGARERALLAGFGCLGAVSAVPGYARPAAAQAAPFDLPRFGFPATLQEFKYILLQLERLREQLPHRRRKSGAGTAHAA